MIRKVSVFFIVALCILTSTAYARTKEVIKQADLDYKIGYRLEQHDWRIGQPAGFVATGVPNIMSELIFEDIESVQARIDGSIDVGSSMNAKTTVHLRAGVAMGSIYEGRNYDDDYAGDNRTNMWISSTQEVEGDKTVDWNLAIGPRFYSESETFYLLPMLGYRLNQSTYNMDSGVVTVFDAANRALLDPIFGPYTGTAYVPPQAFSGLDSYYDTKFEGPTFGLEFGFNPTGKFRLTFGGNYFNMKYRGDGYWNLRGLSFQNHAQGDGYNLYSELGLGLGEHWMLTLSGEYSEWTTKSGAQYWSDGTGSFWQPFIGAGSELSTGMIGLQYNY